MVSTSVALRDSVFWLNVFHMKNVKSTIEKYLNNKPLSIGLTSAMDVELTSNQ